MSEVECPQRPSKLETGLLRGGCEEIKGFSESSIAKGVRLIGKYPRLSTNMFSVPSLERVGHPSCGDLVGGGVVMFRGTQERISEGMR